MSNSKPTSSGMAGGFFIAAGMLGGAIVGVFMGQPSVGMIGGLGFGIVVAVAIWAIDRKRG